VRHFYAAPNQVADILGMQEVSIFLHCLITPKCQRKDLISTHWMQKTVDGKNYYTVEYQLTSPNFSTTSFATIAIGNGKYPTL
jgi:hypothetical protein